MAKPISSKVGKRIRKSARALEKSLDSVRPGNRSSKAKIAGVAGAAMAGAAGVAAAVRRMRRDSPRDAAKMHVVRDEEGWAITSDGRNEPVERFGTKKEAVRAARTAAAEAAPSDLVIHRADGSVEESHSYDPS